MHTGITLRRAFVVCAVVASVHGAASAAVLSDAPLWEARVGDATYPFITTGNTERGLAYNPATGNVLVASRAAGNDGVYVLNGQTGAVVGKLNTAGITGGTFGFSMLGVGGDGAIYTANLTTNSASGTAPFKIYRWESETSGLSTGGDLAPTVVYSGDPTAGAGGTNPRFGDSFAVTGSGANTRIIAGARNPLSTDTTKTLLASFTTSDPAAGFTAQSIAVPHNSGTLGLAFQDSNAAWSKTGATTLKQIALTDGTATVSAESAVADATTAPLGVDGANNLLGLIKYASSTVPGTALQLYDITNPAAPILLDSVNFPTDTVNGNAVGAVAFGDGVVYALATNNGIIAYEIVPEPGALGLLAIAGIGALARRRRAVQ
jgi:hypothetical protein